MEVFEIDTANIRASIARLKTLKEKCDTQKKEKRTDKKKDSGNTHTQLDREYEVMQDSWTQLITLIDKTTNYMQALCDSNDESDTMGANKLKVSLFDSVGDRDFAYYCRDNAAAYNFLRNKGKTDQEIRARFEAGGEESINSWIEQLKFTPRLSPPESNNPYYGNLASVPNCVTYARGRANEILDAKYSNPNERPKIELSGNAKTWWEKYKDCYGGSSSDVNAAKKGAIMVWGGGKSRYGHVAVVEEVNRNEDGTVKNVLYSESSWGGIPYVGKGAKDNATSYWGCQQRNVEGINNVKDGEGNVMDFLGYLYLD